MRGYAKCLLRVSCWQMVIVFDGVCNLCNHWVRFLLSRDQAGQFRFAHCQSEFGRALFARLGESPDDPSTVILIDNEVTYFRSTAILRSVAALGGAWRFVRVLMIVPSSIRDLVYGFVSRRRYRWFGREDHCAIPDPRWQSRFLP